MSDLSSMISASQDALIDAIDFSKLGRPTASYVVDRRTVRVPFLAPKYSTRGLNSPRRVAMVNISAVWLSTGICVKPHTQSKHVW